MICPKCGADRSKEKCVHGAGCVMMGTASQAHKPAWQVMMAANNLCPTERSTPDRMRWMADYFLANFAIEPPAAPVKECLTAEIDLIQRTIDRLLAAQIFPLAAEWRAVAAALATPPASAQAVAEVPYAFVKFSIDYIRKTKSDIPDELREAMINRAWVNYEGTIWRAAQAVAPAQVEQTVIGYIRQMDIDTPIGSAIWAYRNAGQEWSVPIYTRPQAAQPAAPMTKEWCERMAKAEIEFDGNIEAGVGTSKQPVAQVAGLTDALKELMSIVRVHSTVTGENFAWAEMKCAEEALAAKSAPADGGA